MEIIFAVLACSDVQLKGKHKSLVPQLLSHTLACHLPSLIAR